LPTDRWPRATPAPASSSRSAPRGASVVRAALSRKGKEQTLEKLADAFSSSAVVFGMLSIVLFAILAGRSISTSVVAVVLSGAGVLASALVLVDREELAQRLEPLVRFLGEDLLHLLLRSVNCETVKEICFF
jgi:hypothetical protein